MTGAGLRSSGLGTEINKQIYVYIYIYYLLIYLFVYFFICLFIYLIIYLFMANRHFQKLQGVSLGLRASGVY